MQEYVSGGFKEAYNPVLGNTFKEILFKIERGENKIQGTPFREAKDPVLQQQKTNIEVQMQLSSLSKKMLPH